MVNYAEALKKPFSDIKKLLIYIALSIIPIINFMSVGYLLDTAETSMKKKKDLPEWKDFARLFVEGVKAFVIGIVYMIPIFIMGAFVFGPMMTSLLEFNMDFIFENLMLMSTGLIVLGLIALLIGYFSLGALMRYSKTRNMKEAFNFNAISKKVFTGKYFAAWFIGLIIFVLVSAVFSLIPVIGQILGGAIGGIFYVSVLGEAYAEA